MIGQIISHYKILEKLGEGGMGVVYRAEDLKLARTVALKFLHQGVESQDAERSRFLLEARATANLNHPHICTIHDIQEFEGQQFIVMEYVEGKTLSAILPIAKIPDAITYALQIAEALQEAHAHGMIHRDIKTENIMVNSNNQIKVMDFGLAKFKSSLKLTQTGVRLGTFAYMSPEQIRGEELDARSDIFSFGIVLYEMLTGTRPFKADYEQALLYSMLCDEPAPIRDLRPDVPASLEKICRRAMAKEPKDRYQTAAELVRDLESLRSGAAISVKTKTRLTRKQRLFLGGLAVFALALAIAVIFYYRGRQTVFDRVAVLPFQNLSKDSTGEILADGMAWEITEKLQHVASLRVPSIQSTLKFKGSQSSYAEIAHELRASVLVHGSVFHLNDRVRVIASLIDPRTDESLWSETYNAGVEDILDLQSRIAQVLVRAVRVEVTNIEATRLSRSRKVDPKAYELYLKARQSFYSVGADEHQQRAALNLLEQAIALDSSNAAFYPLAVMMYQYGAFFGFYSLDDVLPRMQKAAETAVMLDAESAGSQMALGILNQARWDWKGAEAAFRHALEISPGDPQIHQAYSNMLQWLGRFDEAIARMNLACGIDASIDPHGYWMGATYVNARRFDEAIEKTREFLRQFPGDPVLHLIMGFSYAQKGSCDSATTYLGKSLEISSYDSWIAINCAQMYGICGHYQIARELLNNYLRIQKGRPIESYNVASTYAILRDSTDAYAWLERAYQARSQSLNGLRIDVAWDSQRSNPRYLNMLRRIGLDR